MTKLIKSIIRNIQLRVEDIYRAYVIWDYQSEVEYAMTRLVGVSPNSWVFKNTDFMKTFYCYDVMRGLVTNSSDYRFYEEERG